MYNVYVIRVLKNLISCHFLIELTSKSV